MLLLPNPIFSRKVEFAKKKKGNSAANSRKFWPHSTAFIHFGRCSKVTQEGNFKKYLNPIIHTLLQLSG